MTRVRSPKGSRGGVTRMEFMSRLGVLRVVDPMTDAAYEYSELLGWERDEDDHSSGHPYSTAFHANAFPGDSPYACGRAALYGLMNFPKAPPDRRGRMFMDSGKNLEMELVRRFGTAGWLLSADAGDVQTSFTDDHTWLSGSPDLIVIPHGWDRGHVVEVKGKGQRRPPRYREHIDPLAEMRALREGEDPKHVKQLGAYIGMANREFHKRVPWLIVCEETWSIAGPAPMSGPDDSYCRVHGGNACLRRIEMKPVVDGTLYYVALDDGSVTHEYLHSLDRNWFEAGRAQLGGWRQNFLDGDLPPRPDDWMWSKDPYPCRFCPFKKDACKPDDKEGVTRLEDSNAVKYAKTIRPDYDFRRQRDRVLERWGEKDPQEDQHG